MIRDTAKEIFDFDVIYKTLKIVWICSKRQTIIRIILTFLMALLPLIPLYLFKLLLDSFANFSPNNLSYIINILIGIGFVKLASIIISNLLSYNNSVQGDIVADHMSNILIQKSLQIDLEYFDSDRYHDQFHRAIGQGGTKPLDVLGGVTKLFQNAVSLTAILGLLFSLHWAIAIIIFIITVPVAIVRFIFTEKIVELQKNQTQKNRIAGYYRSVLTGGGNAKEVRIFDFGKQLLSRFLRLAKKLRVERRDLYKQNLKWVSFAQIAEVIAIMSALGFIVYKAIEGRLTVGDISMYYLAFQKGQGNMSGLMSSVISLHKQKLMLSYLFEFLNMGKKIKDPQFPQIFPNTIEKIEIRNVSFTYPETNNQVLNNVSFTASKGEIIAIVGENGSGKTTLVKLINRLYDPIEGAILFNNKDYKFFRIVDIRKNISIIFQNFANYALTVKENIELFRNDNKNKASTKLNKSIESACAKEFIERLPNSVNAKLGRVFKDGHELSKGQWQKIAIARAFYKDAEILILDEPTSFIDPLAEDTIFQNIKKNTKDKITILITHRIYNLKLADKIVVLHRGNLVETGNHETLLAKNGLYAKMFEKQNIE